MEIKLHFYRNEKNIFTRLIHIFTNAELNHVAIEFTGFGDDYIYESTFLGGTYRAKNKKEQPKKTIVFSNSQLVNILNMNHYDIAVKVGAFINRLDSIVARGLSYDFKSLLGWWGKKTEDTNRYYCSELADLVFTDLFKITSDINTQISPKELYIKAKYFQKGLDCGG